MAQDRTMSDGAHSAVSLKIIYCLVGLLFGALGLLYPSYFAGITAGPFLTLFGSAKGALIQMAAIFAIGWVLLFSSVGLVVSKTIDAVTTLIGRYVAWLILLAIIISTVNAIIRKLFDRSSNAWLEGQWVLFGAVFLLCASWTLWSNEHIRIDIVNSRFSKRVRDWIDVLGHGVFLLPLTVIMTYHSWPFFTRSYAINEQSLNAGGLPQWPSKFLVFAGFLVLFFQAVSELIKRVAIMRGEMEDPHAGGGGHAAAAEAEAQRLLEVAEAEAARLAATKS